jgi:hypothetical protein
VLFVGDFSRGHHDSRDRVVDDLLLRNGRNTAALAAMSQLSDQLRAASMQLSGCLVRGPVAAPVPPNHALYPRPAS